MSRGDTELRDIGVYKCSSVPRVNFDAWQKPILTLHDCRFKCNSVGYHFMCKYFVPLLQAAPADFERTIVNVSSSAGYLTNPLPAASTLIAYAESKTSENALTAALHRIYSGEDDGAKSVRGGDDPALRIARVVSIHPGAKRSEATASTARRFYDTVLYNPCACVVQVLFQLASAEKPWVKVPLQRRHWPTRRSCSLRCRSLCFRLM